MSLQTTSRLYVRASTSLVRDLLHESLTDLCISLNIPYRNERNSQNILCKRVPDSAVKLLIEMFPGKLIVRQIGSRRTSNE